MKKVQGGANSSIPVKPIRTGTRSASLSNKVHDFFVNLASSQGALRANFLKRIDDHLVKFGKPLYAYQLQALRRFGAIAPSIILQAQIHGRTRPKREAKSALLVSPTGSGKTTIFSPEILRDVEQGRKVLVLTHRNFLGTQIKERLEEVCPDDLKAKLFENKIQFINGKDDLKAARLDKPITIASIHALGENLDDISKSHLFKEFDTIVIDEAHHYTANNFLQTLDTIVANISKKKDLKIIGATATPLRHSPGAAPLNDIFPTKNIIWTRTMMQLILDGKLKQPRGIRINTNLGEELSVDKETQNINQKDMEDLSCKPEFNKLLFDSYQKYSKDKNAIFFAHGKEAARLMLKEAINRKIPVAMILGDETVLVDPKTWEKTTLTGEKAIEARRTVFDAYGKTTKIIINCEVLTEGIDLPQTQALVMGTLTRSIQLLQQIIGRGVRLDPNNPHEREFDFIYLDPQTRKKFRFANLSTLGLGQFEKIIEGPDFSYGGSILEAKSMQNDLELDGTKIEGTFIDRPDPEWEKILNRALDKARKSNDNFQGIPNLEEAKIRLTELLAISTTSQLNLSDLVAGSDILFGAQGSTKIREAQRLFREMLKILDLDLKEIIVRFPRLTGFETFTELKDFLRSLSPHRPRDLNIFLRDTNERFGIDDKYIKTLDLQESNKERPPAKIFDEIWHDNPNWDTMYTKACADPGIATKDPKKKISKQKLLNKLNKLLKEKRPIKTPIAKAANINSTRDLLIFVYKHKLTGEDYKSLIDELIPRLEIVNWLEDNRRLLENGQLTSDQETKLAREPIAMQKPKPISTQLDPIETLKQASLLKRSHGLLGYNSSIIKHLESLLQDFNLGTFSFPLKLKNEQEIQQCLSKIAKISTQLTKHIQKTKIQEALSEHLRCINFVRNLLKDPKVRNPQDDKERNFSVQVKGLVGQ